MNGAGTADDKEAVRSASNDGNSISATLEDSLKSGVGLDKKEISN
jgi:hypothetical protein